MCLYRDVIRWSVWLMLLALGGLALALGAGLGHVFAPLLVTYLVAGVGLIRFPWGRFLEHSDLSYGVYLIHSLVLSLLMHWFAFDNWIVLFLAAWLVSLMLAWVSWNVIERPALDHKSMPADLVRRLARSMPLPSGGTARDR